MNVTVRDLIYRYAPAGSDCDPGKEGVSINVLRAPIEILFTGMQMAGPNLSPQSFAQGLYNYPKSTAAPNGPLYYFTPGSPNAYKDFTEIFWDNTYSGKDETSKDGVGAILKVAMGKRYQALSCR